MRNMFGSHTPGGEFRGYVDGFGNVCDSSTKLPVGRVTRFGVEDSSGHPIGIVDQFGNINNGSVLPAGRIDSFGNMTSRL